jgi:GntR family transcriptional regulator
MHIQVDFRSAQPIYQQIVDQIRDMVAGGSLQPGDQLPTVRQLATDLRVNFNTVARAYRLLDEAGMISTQQGRGTYIWASPDKEASDRLRQQRMEEMAEHFVGEAERLGYAPEEVVKAFEIQMKDWLERRKPATTNK